MKGRKGGETVSTHKIRSKSGRPQLLDDFQPQVDQARLKRDDVGIAATDRPRTVRAQVLSPTEKLLARQRVRLGSGSGELRDGHGPSNVVRAAAGEANFGRCETRDDLVEPTAGRDDVPRLAALDVRLEDGAVAVKVVVGREEWRDSDVFDAELAAERDDVFELVEAFLGDVLESRDGGEDEGTHLSEIAYGRRNGELASSR